MNIPINITILNHKNKKLWDAYVLNHPRGIAYQLFAFREAIEVAYRFKCIYLIAKNGKQIRGVLPLVQVHIPGFKGKLVSLPYCDAGGPLADTPIIENNLILYAMEFARQHGIKSVEIRSVQGFAGLSPDLTRNNQKSRMLLKLPDSKEHLMSSLKVKVRSQVKKPMRDGLVFEIGGTELLKPFYQIFSKNMRDLGSPVHSCEWIRQLLLAYGNRAHIGIVKMPDGRLAAGGILLCHPKIVSIPLASSLRALNRWNPNMLLYWHFLAFAATNGYPVFDFGRSTPGEGTYRFKKQWGATPAPLHWAIFNTNNHMAIPESSGHAVVSSIFRKPAAFVLSKVPTSIMTCLGSHSRKYISL